MATSFLSMIPSITSVLGPPLLMVAGGLAAVHVVGKGSQLIIEKIRGPVDNRSEYGGHKWDSDVVRSAMQSLENRRRSGQLLDRESYRALAAYKRGR